MKIEIITTKRNAEVINCILGQALTELAKKQGLRDSLHIKVKDIDNAHKFRKQWLSKLLNKKVQLEPLEFHFELKQPANPSPMKEYLEQRIAYVSTLPKPTIIEKTLYETIVYELQNALNHLNKIENEKS